MYTFNELSDETMKQVFSPVLKEDHDSTLPYKYIECKNAALYCFSGASSPLTPACQDELSIQIDGKSYASVDEYVWERKFWDLTGRGPLASKCFRGDLTKRGVSVSDLENWVLKRGLLYMQKAILCKLQTDRSFYQLLLRTGQKYICYTYNKETFYSTGTPKNEMCDWFSTAAKFNFHVKIPLRFPLYYTDLHHAPLMPNDGHNVLGLIYMAIREAILTKGLHNLTVEIPPNDPNSIPESVRIATEHHIQHSSKQFQKKPVFSAPIPPQDLAIYQFTRPPVPSFSISQTGYAQSNSSNGSTLIEFDQHKFRHQAGTSSLYTPNSTFGAMRLQSNASNGRQSNRADGHPRTILKEDVAHGETYSTMPTPSVSSVSTSVFNIRNWQSPDQIDIVRQAAVEKENRRKANAGYTPSSEVIERQQLAQEAIDDEELTRRILAYGSERSTNRSAKSTPAYNSNSPNHFAQYRPIKRELDEDDAAEDDFSISGPTSSKRHA